MSAAVIQIELEQLQAETLFYNIALYDSKNIISLYFIYIVTPLLLSNHAEMYWHTCFKPGSL